MTNSPRVLAVSGSRRDGSNTLAALRHALDAAGDAGADTDLLDLGSVDLPLYHPDRDDGEQGEARALMTRTRRADAVLVGSPVYHDSYSSTFKNYHDYCGYDEFEDTVVGMVAAAGGSNYATTLSHLRGTLVGVHADVLPRQVGIAHASGAVEGGAVTDEDVAERLEDLARRLVQRARTVQRVA